MPVFAGILGDILDGSEHKMMAEPHSSVAACEATCAQKTTKVKFNEVLSSRDCRTGWRGLAVFWVTICTFAVLKQPRFVPPSCARWSSALKHDLQGARRTSHHGNCQHLRTSRGMTLSYDIIQRQRRPVLTMMPPCQHVMAAAASPMYLLQYNHLC